MENQKKTYNVYVWELPVRFFHMVNGISLAVLIITGLIIGTPPAIQGSEEAYFGYWFGTVRFLHFSAAYIFLLNWVYRIFWSLIGNSYARWQNFLPVTSKQWLEIMEVVKVDILQQTRRVIIPIGHNALAYFIYLMIFIAGLFQIFTGFAMYAAMSDFWFAGLFSWVIPFMGGDIVVRYWHHLIMWIFILFTIVHLYLIIYHEFMVGHKVLKSIITGWKNLVQDMPSDKK